MQFRANLNHRLSQCQPVLEAVIPASAEAQDAAEGIALDTHGHEDIGRTGAGTAG